MSGIGISENDELHLKKISMVDKHINYELGDFVLHKGRHNKSFEYCQSSEHQLTIGCKYISKYPPILHQNKSTDMLEVQKNESSKADIEYLNILVNEYRNNYTTDAPSENTTVVHLRLGDSVSSDNCFEVKCNKYVLTKSEYLALLYSSDIPSNNSIVIVGFPFHLPVKANRANLLSRLSYEDFSHYLLIVTRSIQYRTEIAMFFQCHFREVVVRELHTPDEDFVYMSSAKHFIGGEGGFSDLVGQLVRYNNGKTYSLANSTVRYHNYM
jgi:hypothetical protein